MQAGVARRLIAHARALCADGDRGAELDATVYATDPSTFDMCLSVSP